MIGRNEFMDLQEQIDNIPGYMPEQYQPAPAIWDGGDPEYVSVSYDSDDEEFTVTITDLPVVWTQGENKDQTGYAVGVPQFPVNKTTETTVMSKTFTFDKPPVGTGQTLYLYCAPPKSAVFNDTASGNIYWFGNNLVASNSTTQDREVEFDGGSLFWKGVLFDTGIYTVADTPLNVPVVAGYVTDLPYFMVNTTTRKIWLYNVVDPINPSVSPNGNGHDYTEPFNEIMILGFSYGDSRATLDRQSNGSDYNTWYPCGYININSDNVPLAAETVNLNSRALVSNIGWNGSFTTHDGKTVTVDNGLITNVS